MNNATLSRQLEHSNDANIIIAEGSMGLYDGVAAPGLSGNGASADIAALMGWPVILVIDTAGQAQSAAAVARGFATMRSDVEVAGVILNRVASPRHEALLRRGMEYCGIAVFGTLPRNHGVALPERHLGLVQAEESESLTSLLDALGGLAEAHLDLDAITSAARRRGGHWPPCSMDVEQPRLPPPGQKVALARDRGFSFVYPHLEQEWRTAGAEIMPFSPLANEAPAMDADVCWLPGGYPELHAGRLASAHSFKEGLRRFAVSRPVHGECGGYMVLGEGLVDAQGIRHAMCGLLGLETSFEKRRLHLGYRKVRLLAPVAGFPADTCLVGHEFHYSSIVSQPDAPLAEIVDAAGSPVPETGSFRGMASGSFFHLIGQFPQRHKNSP